MKRFLALFVCSVLIFGVFPLGVLAEIEEYGEITVIPDCEFPENDELFAGYVEKTFYPEMAFAAWGRSARDMLSENDKYMYDWMKSNVEKIANGSQVSAIFYAESNLLSTWTGVTRSFSSNHINQFFGQFDHQNIIEALLQDCPYELYWFDKASGYQLGAARVGNNITKVMAIMSVSIGYRASNYNANEPKVSAGTAVSAAMSNAQSLVNSYASMSDYEKLSAYRDEICRLTDYNYDILEEADPDYGDPWQLIHVFDGDASTKVVCEGYSKAFKYLCDISEFNSSEIACYSVVGNTNGGGHMWNIVTMNDGKNYIVDVTNSDSGTIGQNGGLFLNGMSGSPSAGYSKNFYKTMTYIYNDDTKWLWGTDSESILNLSSTDYDPYFPTITISNGEIVYDGKEVTVGKTDSDFNFVIQSNSNVGGYNVTVEWYKDNGGNMGAQLANAPKDVGTYWVKITATHGTHGSTNFAKKQFTITPKLIHIQNAECYDKKYDGTSSARLSAIVYLGVISGDEVDILANISFLTPDVGEKNQALLTDITLLGASASNYKVEADELIVNISPAYILKRSYVAAPEMVSGGYNINSEAPDTFVYTVTPIEGAEYKMDDGAWQDSNVFKNIAPYSTHSFYARLKETETAEAGQIAEGDAVYFAKLENVQTPIIQAEVSGETGNRTVTVIAEGNVEYSFDNGLTWTDNKVLNGVADEFVVCAVRFKETATTYASDMATLQVSTLKLTQSAPEAFEIQLTLNPDGETYTATLPLLENALYSFDGINFSANNQKVDCLPDTEIKAYIKFAETDEFGESIATVVSVKIPVTETYLKGDINENGVIDSMDYVLLKRAYFGTYKLKKLKIGDINDNQSIDSMDYVLLKRVYFGTYAIK